MIRMKIQPGVMNGYRIEWDPDSESRFFDCPPEYNEYDVDWLIREQLVEFIDEFNRFADGDVFRIVTVNS